MPIACVSLNRALVCTSSIETIQGSSPVAPLFTTVLGARAGTQRLLKFGKQSTRRHSLHYKAGIEEDLLTKSQLDA